MPVQVVCPNPECGASLSMPPDQAGRMVACPACGTSFEMVGETRSDGVYPPFTRGRTGSQGTPPVGLPSPFGRYRIIRKLGQGGMGAVYLGHDVELDRPVALKVPHFELGTDPDVIERFRREARAAAGFHHPNFCPIHDVGQVGGTHYLAMAFIEGETLSARVNRAHPMAPRKAARIVRHLALALTEAHRRGIIHRDLKPANVMVDPRGTLIIMDFGLARRIGGGDSDLTRTGVPMGTPHYMSPEQVRGTKHDLGPATDIYALGVILYELSTGRRPFEGPLTAVIGAVLHIEPPPPSSLRPELDAELESICLKAMAKRTGDRYPTMEALAGDLAAYLDRPAPVTPPPNRKRPLLLAAGALLLGLLGVIVYVITDRGTLKIEGFAPGMEIRVDGREVRIEKMGQPIVVRSGEHGLLVTRGDVLVKAPRSFEVRRGEETIVTLELIDPNPSLAAEPPRPVEALPIKPTEDEKKAPQPPPPPKVAETEPMSRDATKATPSPPPTEFTNAALPAREAAIMYNDRGQAWKAKGDLDKALADFTEAIRLDPKYADAYYFRGLTWDEKGDLDKAMTDYDEAIRIDPNDVYYFFVRGLTWDSKGNFDKALADYDEAIRIDPKYAPAYNHRGNAWKAKGNLVKTLADYSEAIRIDPKDADCHGNLAWILAVCPDAKYRDGKRAVELAMKACELSSWKNPDFLDTLAAAHAEAGDFEVAVRREEEALGLAKGASNDGHRFRLRLYQEKKAYRDPELTPRPSSNP